MDVVLVEHPAMSGYRFTRAHPLRPERFILAIELMRAWGLIGPQRACVVVPDQATDADLELVHDTGYVAAVRGAAELTSSEAGRFGLGPGDTPAFPGMHEAAALAVGATSRAVSLVLSGEAIRAHNPAGGLHHAHRDHASGFCVYNDAAIAIEWATRRYPGIRVAYVDIDAHHGDGVEAVFVDRSDVLTVSVHESGSYLFPGTGRVTDIGVGEGAGFAINVPLLPFAGPESYNSVVKRVVRPSLARFKPELIVAQTGADSHRNDPLTHLHGSVAAFDTVVAEIVATADDLCGGRMVALGGGGYDTFSAVPRMWACVMARLLGEEPPLALPQEWIERARSCAAEAGVAWQEVDGTYAEHIADQPDHVVADLTRETNATIERLLRDHPLFA